MTVRLVVLRHASAGLRCDWPTDDELRPLDRFGAEQAAALVGSLADVSLDDILTSRYVRCRETVVALAAARELPVVDEPWLAEGASRLDVAGGLRRIASDTLVCTHGDVVETIGACLAPDAGPRQLAKAAAWLIELADGAVVGWELLAAPEPERDDQPVRT